MAEDLVLAERVGTVLKVTLNRSEKANALTRDMLEQLRDIFDVAAEDDDLRVMTIEGAGDRVFCGGADLGELADSDGDPDDEIWEDVAEALSALPFLTIAKINGPCIGGALTLALNCDIRLCVPEAEFGYPVLRNTVLPNERDGRRLEALIGPGRKALILLGGSRAGAEEALAWGLADRLVSRDQLDQTVEELSAAALASTPGHLEVLKTFCVDTKP